MKAKKSEYKYEKKKKKKRRELERLKVLVSILQIKSILQITKICIYI